MALCASLAQTLGGSTLEYLGLPVEELADWCKTAAYMIKKRNPPKRRQQNFRWVGGAGNASATTPP